MSSHAPQDSAHETELDSGHGEGIDSCLDTSSGAAHSSAHSSALSSGAQSDASLTGTPARILALVDSDSYLKWAAATLDSLTLDAHSRIIILQSPIAPSLEQQKAALSGTSFANVQIQRIGMHRLSKTLADLEPDIVLMAGTGPIIEVATELTRNLPRPPALISGIPGMALPARKRGLEYRARIHAMIVHSTREADEYDALQSEMGLTQHIVVNRLPFLPTKQQETRATTASLVFTPQALVPASATQRERILTALHEVARRHPQVDVIVKVRALAGERQTHNERFPYDELWKSMCAENPELTPGSVRFAAGPLADYLVPGAAHVTVSSTAALESVASGLPTLVLTDFGLNERLLNAVYQSSNLTGTLADLEELRFGAPDPTWLARNYFHEGSSQLSAVVAELAEQSRRGLLEWHEPLNWRKRKRRLAKSWLRSALPSALVVGIADIRKTLRPRTRRTLA